jgi:hypothetical protein
MSAGPFVLLTRDMSISKVLHAILGLHSLLDALKSLPFLLAANQPCAGSWMPFEATASIAFVR